MGGPEHRLARHQAAAGRPRGRRGRAVRRHRDDGPGARARPAGPDAGQRTRGRPYAALLGLLGAGIFEVLDGPAGLAASKKLLRSVFYKGMAASIVEALEAARAAGDEPWLREHIAAELAAADATTVDRIVDGTRRHAVRRTAEMAAATEMLTELGVPPLMADASRALHERLADSPAAPYASGASAFASGSRDRAGVEREVHHGQVDARVAYAVAAATAVSRPVRVDAHVDRAGDLGRVAADLRAALDEHLVVLLPLRRRPVDGVPLLRAAARPCAACASGRCRRS